jgi:hypothetical protein
VVVAAGASNDSQLGRARVYEQAPNFFNDEGRAIGGAPFFTLRYSSFLQGGQRFFTTSVTAVK